MYNSKRKEQYLREKADKAVVANNIYSIFSMAEKREEMYGRDLAEWSSKEIIDLYKYLSSSSVQSLIFVHSQLTSYAQWCIMNGLVKDNQNHYTEINSSTLLKCVDTETIEKMIISREELLKEIQELPNYTDRFMFLGIFEGITMKNHNLSNVKISDLNGNVVKLSDGTELPISNELVNIMHVAAEETTWISMGKREKEYQLVEGDTIIRPINAPNGVTENITIMIGGRIRRCAKFLGRPKITIKMLAESGRIDFIKRKAAEYGIKTEDMVFGSTHSLEQEKIYGKVQNKSIYMSMYGKYLE